MSSTKPERGREKLLTNKFLNQFWRKQFWILVYQTKIRLYSSFSDWFGNYGLNKIQSSTKYRSPTFRETGKENVANLLVAVPAPHRFAQRYPEHGVALQNFLHVEKQDADLGLAQDRGFGVFQGLPVLLMEGTWLLNLVHCWCNHMFPHRASLV